MKKVICLILAILVCASLAIPALAESFVPSITYKGKPELVSAEDENGNKLGCLYIMPVSKAKKSDTPDAKLLTKLYKELADGTATLPYDKVDGIDADKMVIRELVSVLCNKGDDHGVVTVTLDLGVKANAKVAVMDYENDAWAPAKNVVNNGDGTVTFAVTLGPVAIAVEA